MPDEERRAALVGELAKLDPDEERALAEEGFASAGESTETLLEWIQAWYESHCDDD